MLWDFIQQRQIDNVLATAERAKDSALKAAVADRELSDRLDRLALVTQAMWELLSSVHRISEDQLKQKMQEIDLRDGTSSNTGEKCKRCDRIYSTRHNQCLYCGEKNLVEMKNPFSGI